MSDIETESTTPKGPLLISLLIVGGMMLLALASFAMLKSRGPVVEAGAARAGERRQARLDLAKEGREKMNSYAWVNKEAGKVSVPVDLAIKTFAPKLAQQTPAPSGEPAPLTPGPSDAPVAFPAVTAPEAAPVDAAAPPAKAENAPGTGSAPDNTPLPGKEKA